LEDIQLTLWPIEVIARQLPAGWRIVESGRERVLYHDNVMIAKIYYGEEKRWSGTVILDNLHYKYRLTIQTANEPNN